MSIKIRKGVFETNSSSSHSIYIDKTIDSNMLDFSLIPDKNGVITIESTQFLESEKRLETALEKIQYVWQVTGEIDKISDVIKNQTGAIKIVFKENNESYIEGESAYSVCDVIDDPVKLHNLIFNKRSLIYIEGRGEPGLNFYCDSKLGRYKLSVVESHVYRNNLLNNLLSENNKDIKLNWIYMFTKSKEHIEDAVVEFFEHYINNDKYYYNTDIDFNNLSIMTKERYSHSYGNTGNKLEYKIIIEENKNE